MKLAASWVLLTLTLVGGAAFAQYAPQQAGSTPLEPQLEARVQSLGKQLRCVVCQGMSIADSPASMARAQMDVVRNLVQQGKSDEEIRKYFVARYGEFALLEPTHSASNMILWLGPAAFLVIGLGFVLAYTMKHSARPSKPETTSASAGGETAAAAPSSTSSSSEEDPYLSAVRAELDR